LQTPFIRAFLLPSERLWWSTPGVISLGVGWRERLGFLNVSELLCLHRWRLGFFRPIPIASPTYPQHIPRPIFPIDEETVSCPFPFSFPQSSFDGSVPPPFRCLSHLNMVVASYRKLGSPLIFQFKCPVSGFCIPLVLF